MAKNYLPSQNEILPKMTKEEKNQILKSGHNILGRTQGIEMSHPLMEAQKEDAVNMEEGGKEREEWADALRSADERTKKYKDLVETMEKEISGLKKSIEVQGGQIVARDSEIKRLQGLYEGGQNLEKLSI